MLPASAVAGSVLTVTVASDYAVGDQVRIVANSAGTDCSGSVGVYTIKAIAGDLTTVTFVEDIGTVATAAHCSLVGATGRCTSKGSQTTAQIAAKGMTACTSAGGTWTPSFVQRNKHGGIYTYGNLERYPFGRNVPYTDSQNALAYHHETGFTTYGYTSYETLYGYTAAGAVTNANPGVHTDDTTNDAIGANVGTDCGSTEMDVTAQAEASALWAAGTVALTPSMRPDMRKGVGKVADNTGAAVYFEPGTTTACLDRYSQSSPDRKSVV